MDTKIAASLRVGALGRLSGKAGGAHLADTHGRENIWALQELCGPLGGQSRDKIHRSRHRPHLQVQRARRIRWRLRQSLHVRQSGRTKTLRFSGYARNSATFLESLGLKCMLGGAHGIPAPARWAAYQAGLGIIRRNNFFYTEKGSYIRIEMLAVDRRARTHSRRKAQRLFRKLRQMHRSLPDPYAVRAVYHVDDRMHQLSDQPVGEYGHGRTLSRDDGADRRQAVRLRRVPGRMPL